MAKYKRKPEIVEAIQWNGQNLGKIIDFVRPETTFVNRADNLTMEIPGSEILLIARYDFIIEGVDGEFYQRESDIFNLNYELIKEKS